MTCRAHRISSCHLVDFTGDITRSRTFFGDVLTVAEMLIIQTCPVLWNWTQFDFFTIWDFFFKGVINYHRSCLCRFTLWTLQGEQSVLGCCRAAVLLYIHIFHCMHEQICLHLCVVKTVLALLKQKSASYIKWSWRVAAEAERRSAPVFLPRPAAYHTFLLKAGFELLIW